MKVCFKCNKKKSSASFYKHGAMSDGLLGKCIGCTKKDVKANYRLKAMNPKWVESERTRGRKKYQKLYAGSGKANVASNYKWASKYPEKKSALSFSNSMIPPGPGLEKHHWSYNEDHFKDVIWLTKKHHMKAHRFLIYDSEQKKYRRYDNNELLETKKRHQSFVLSCIRNKED